jgi:CheY-like chemotaxis protein
MSVQKILIIDDNKEIQSIAREYLEFEGFEILSAHNGMEALELLAEGNLPDLILLDLVMPKMDGVEFMHLKKSDSRISDIPVILLSGLAEEAQHVKPEGRVQKPFGMSTLSKAISEVFARLALA